jgi:hypothetical protein
MTTTTTTQSQQIRAIRKGLQQELNQKAIDRAIANPLPEFNIN